MAAPTFAELYEQRLVPYLFAPFASDLLDRARPGPGERVLDVACGTGIVARLARARAPECRVSGLDASPAMLEVARVAAREPDAPDRIEWREGNASDLPYEDGAFDLVVSQAGFQFFPDRPAAAREMRRVLAPGGRLALSVWRSLEEQRLMHDLARVAARHLGELPPDRRHGFGDAEALRVIFVEAGFADASVTTVELTVRFPDASGLVALNLMAIAPSGFAALPEHERARLAEAVQRDSADVVAAYTDGAGVAFPVRANVVTARGVC